MTCPLDPEVDGYPEALIPRPGLCGNGLSSAGKQCTGRFEPGATLHTFDLRSRMNTDVLDGLESRGASAPGRRYQGL